MKLRNLLLLLLTFMWGTSCVDNMNQNQYGLSQSEVHELVEQYTDALDSLAQVLPIIGGDSESTWAANQVSEQRKVLLERDFSLTEGLATTYRMHNYISYGMTYFLAITGLYRSVREEAGSVMNMISLSDSLYYAMAQNSFSDMTTFEDFYAYTFYYAQLYGVLYNAQNKVQVFSDSGFGHSLRSRFLVEEVAGITPDVRFKMSRILEGASFFHAYCVLINGFATSQEILDAHKDTIISHATFFDEKSNEVYSAIESRNFDAEIFSDKNFSTFMKESTDRKIWMLRRLTEEIKLIGNIQSK